jgi:hypothetical protein
MFVVCERDADRNLAAAANAADAWRLFGPTQESASARHEGLLRQCAWCQRISVGLNVWVNAGDAMQVLPFLSLAMPEEITHGVCPDCFYAFLSEKQTAGGG